MNDKRLRIAIEDSVTQKIISENLLICCIAVLHNKIVTSEQHQSINERKRQILAKIAVDKLGIDKIVLANKITQLSEGCYPTFKAVNRVLEMIARGYTVDNTFISDDLMKYKSNEEVKAIVSIPEPKNEGKKYVIVDNTFIEICNHIESEYDIEMNDRYQRELIKEINGHDFDAVQKALQWNKSSINSSLWRNDFGGSSYAKLKYILGCVNRLLPKTEKRIEKQKRYLEDSREQIERHLNELAKSSANHSNNGGAKYQKKTKELTSHQKKLFEELR